MPGLLDNIVGGIFNPPGQDTTPQGPQQQQQPGWGQRISGFFQDPRMMAAMAAFMPNPTDRQILMGLSQAQSAYQQIEMQKRKEEADKELRELRKQALEYEVSKQEERGQIGEQLAGLISTPGFNPQEAAGLLARLGHPMAALEMVGVGAKPQDRKILKDVAGMARYVDTGERVFPGVAKPLPPAKPRAEKPSVLAQRGLEGWSRDALARIARKQQMGEDLTLEDLTDRANALQYLSTERLTRTPSGELTAYRPGVPEFGFGPTEPQVAPGPALPPGAPTGGPLLQQRGLLEETPIPGGLLPAEPEVAPAVTQAPADPRIGGPLLPDVPSKEARETIEAAQTPAFPADPGQLQFRKVGESKKARETKALADEGIKKIYEIKMLLKEAEAAGESITGIAGTYKTMGGASLARQLPPLDWVHKALGIKATPRAELLQTRLDSLFAMLKPIATNEGGQISDQDVRHAKRLIGEINVTTDAVRLDQLMREMAKFLNDMKGRY